MQTAHDGTDRYVERFRSRRILLFQAAHAIYMVVVIANGDRERFLCVILLDHKAIQMRFYLFWCRIKFERIDCIMMLFRWFVRGGLLRKR